MTLKFMLMLLVLGLHSYSNACQCAEIDERIFIANASSVFVVKIQFQTNTLVTGKLQKSFKGTTSDLVDFTYPKEPECYDKPLDHFKIGQSYLIATNGYKSPSGNSKVGEVGSKICEIYSELKTSKALIKWLNSKEFKSTLKSKK